SSPDRLIIELRRSGPTTSPTTAVTTTSAATTPASAPATTEAAMPSAVLQPPIQIKPAVEKIEKVGSGPLAEMAKPETVKPVKSDAAKPEVVKAPPVPPEVARPARRTASGSTSLVRA